MHAATRSGSPHNALHSPSITEIELMTIGVETTEVEAHMASYSLFAIDYQWQAAHRQYKFQSRRFEQSLQDGKGHPKRHFIGLRNSAHVMTLV